MKTKSLILFIALLCFLLSCSLLFKKGFPQYSGEIKKMGGKKPVEIYRDAYGIPHIYAQNEHDLYFTQGYVHAQDRLWQMEQLRRLVKGRLSEIVGKDTVEVDMFMRLLGMNKAITSLADQASERMKTVARVYIDGVNAYIEARKDNLPIEFSALKLLPEHYTEEDVFAAVLLNSWGLNQNFSSELLAAKMMKRLAADAFADLFPSYPNARLPSDDYFNTLKSLKVAPYLQTVDAFRELSQDGPNSAGSNSWVVSGERSVSGLPLLANDPHLAQNVPSVWYFNHLNAPGFHVAGASIAGSPCVVIGYNEKVAWGVTAAMTDYVDLYVIKVDPEHPTRYFIDGKMLDMEREEITIRIKDSQPEHRTIYHTIHGPVITDVKNGKGYNAHIAIKWHGTTTDKSFEAFYKINHASKVEEVFEAGRYFGIVCLNIVTADKDGNDAPELP